MILTVGKVILHEAPVAFIITPSLLHFVLLDAIHDIKEKKTSLFHHFQICKRKKYLFDLCSPLTSITE